MGNYEHQKVSEIEEVLSANKFLTFNDKYIGGGKGKLKGGVKVPTKGTSKGMASANRKLPADIDKKLREEVEEVKDNMVRVKGYTGWFKTVKIVPLEKGIKLQKKLNKAKAKYMKITQQADNELRETVKEISQ